MTSIRLPNPSRLAADQGASDALATLPRTCASSILAMCAALEMTLDQSEYGNGQIIACADSSSGFCTYILDTVKNRHNNRNRLPLKSASY